MSEEDRFTIESAGGGGGDFSIEPTGVGPAIRSGLSGPGQIAGAKYLPEAAFGATQTVGALGQFLAHLSGDQSLTAPLIKAMTGMGPAEAADAANQKMLDFYKQTFGSTEPPGGEFAKGVGQSAVMAPFFPAGSAAEAATPGILKSAGIGGAKGAGSGALGGVLTPVYGDTSDFFTKKLKQATEGGVVGGILGGVLGGGGRMIGGGGAPDADRALLQSEGVRLTPPQASGGWFKDIEDKLSSYPIIGNLIKSRWADSASDFQKALYSRAVAPFGDEGAQVVAKAKVGHPGVAAVGDFLSSKYEQGLAQSVPSPVTPEFQQTLNQIASMVPSAKRQDFIDIVAREIQGKTTPAGTLTPSVAKDIDSALGNLYAKYRKSPLGDDQVYADALAQTQSEVRELFAANNPESAAIIRGADEGWKTLVQIEKAANAAGARKDGIFSPANFLSAVFGSDSRVRHRGMSRGEAWNQDFAGAAARVLPSTVPDSGTTGRAVIGAAVGALAGKTLPVVGAAVPYLAGLTGIASSPWLPGVSPLVSRMMLAQRPQSMVTLGDLVSGSAPYLAPGAAAAAANQ